MHSGDFFILPSRVLLIAKSELHVLAQRAVLWGLSGNDQNFTKIYK